MITINCDIGERGPDHPIDMALMDLIQMANIACGGHAGDKESVAAFRKRSDSNQVKIAAHLSYPDRENFGRFSMDISTRRLNQSLDDQMQLLPDIRCVKFHGALYNDSVINPQLAADLTNWLVKNRIEQVVTSQDSELANSSQQAGINVIFEAFAERRYAFLPNQGRLTLVSRKKSYASITDCQEALEHSQSIIRSGLVKAYIEDEKGILEERLLQIKAQTICIHSDSTIALELARELNKLQAELT
jgi:UPF0271 protein